MHSVASIAIQRSFTMFRAIVRSVCIHLYLV